MAVYLVTAHRTFIGVDGTEGLVQVEAPQAGPSRLAELDAAQPSSEIRSGPLAGFRLNRMNNHYNLIKGGKFLCAHPDKRRLLANRLKADVFERFYAVRRERLQVVADVIQSFASPDSEVARFQKRVAELNVRGEPVKIHCGCGQRPLPGFLNIDGYVMEKSFWIDHSDNYFIFPFSDMSWGIPDNSVDYVFDEDFIEHITQQQQIQFLAETRRVLKPGCYHRVNTPNLITSMKRHSDFAAGYEGVYKGELRHNHVSIFSPTSLKEMAELVGYREVVFTTRNHGVSPFAEQDTRPHGDRDPVVGNIFADLQK